MKTSSLILFILISLFSCKTMDEEQLVSSTKSSKEVVGSDTHILKKIEDRFRFLPNSPEALLKQASASGAYRYNRKCDELNNSPCVFYIEEQLKGFIILYAGLYHKNNTLIDGGLKILKWGFSKADPRGGFSTSKEPFHSSSFYIDAVAHALLVLKELRPEIAERKEVKNMAESLMKSLEWFISEPLWSNGIRHNYAMAHRHFIVASAIGLSLKVSERYNLSLKAQIRQDAEDKMNEELYKAMSRLQKSGVMPELGGHDSSYQMAGVLWGAQWLSYYGDHRASGKVRRTLTAMSRWELTRISASGDISTKGNKRTGGRETGRTGVAKSRL